MNFIKVLGIGSPFGDDQVGWRVAEALKDQISVHDNISQYVIIESHDRPGVRLIELMNEASTIFIIDAVKSNSKPGTIFRFKNNEIFESENRLSTHGIGISQALQLGYALDALPDNIILYGVGVDIIEFGTTLSQPVERAIIKVVTRLKNEIIKMLF